MHAKKRLNNQVRELSVSYGIFDYADGSVLYQLGNTKILCAITIQKGVPPFIRGSHTGWLTAYYSMLPTSTHHRIERESNTLKKNGRFVEISRLIGRSLRSVARLKALGEKTIVVDCDVLQADGGTRTACITAASLAIRSAEKKWLDMGLISEPIMTQSVYAISVGFMDGQAILDPDFYIDSHGDGDFNFVCTASGNIIEVQGSSEKKPIAWPAVMQMYDYARKGIAEMVSILKDAERVSVPQKQAPLFSLARRMELKR